MKTSRFEQIPLRFKDKDISNFLIDDTNRLAAKAVSTITPGQSILLTGTTGTGKTHLAISAMKCFPPVEVNSSEAERKKQEAEYYLKYGEEEDKTKAQSYLDRKDYLYRKPTTAFIPAVELFVCLNEASYDKGKLQLLDELVKFDLLIIDDLGAERLTDASRQNLYYLIDARYREMKSTIVTTNYSFVELHQVEPRIASRLAEMGLMFNLKGKDKRLQK